MIQLGLEPFFMGLDYPLFIALKTDSTGVFPAGCLEGLISSYGHCIGLDGVGLNGKR